MINLLPPQYKKELLAEEQRKLVLIMGIFVLILLLFFSLIFLAIQGYIQGELTAQRIILEQREQEFQSPRIQNLQSQLLSLNETLSRLNSFYQNQFPWTEKLTELSLKLVPGVRFTALSVGHGKEKQEQLEFYLQGLAQTREDLLKFKENLEADDSFSQVYFPASNWVKKADISFVASFNSK